MRRSRSKCALCAPRFDGARREGAVRHFETGAAALREGAKAAEQRRPSKPFSKLFQISALSKSFRGIGLFLAVFQPSSRPAAVRGHRSPNGCVTLWDGRDAFMARSDPDAENLEPSLDS